MTEGLLNITTHMYAKGDIINMLIGIQKRIQSLKMLIDTGNCDEMTQVCYDLENELVCLSKLKQELQIVEHESNDSFEIRTELLRCAEVARDVFALCIRKGVRISVLSEMTRGGA